jgi:Domain of unknown function (DUF1707)
MPEPRDQVPAALGRGHLRACHADREQVIGVLKAAFVQGRLGRDELNARVGQALAARTYADLATLTADLPAGLAAAEPPYQPARGRAPRPVRTAAWLMCLGAALTLADAATVLVTLGGVRSAAVQDVDFTGGRWHIFMLTVIVPALASAPIVAGVWLWLGDRPGLWLGAACFRGVLQPGHYRVAHRPRHGRRQGRHVVYRGRPARHDGALAGRASGDDAHFQPEGQPVLPAPGSNASSDTGKRSRGERSLTRHQHRIRPGRRCAGHA